MTITVPAKQPRKHEETWHVLTWSWGKWHARITSRISGEQALVRYMQAFALRDIPTDRPAAFFPVAVVYRKGRVKNLVYCRDTSPDILHKIHNQPDFKGYFKNLKL